MFVSRKRHRSVSYSVVVLEKDSRTRENGTIQIICTSSVIGPELIYGSLYDRIGYGELKNDM